MQRWRRWILWDLAGLMILVGAGCARHTISETVCQQADRNIAFAALRANPGAYKDRMVIVGGTLLDTYPLAQRTRLTIIQHPLDHHEVPRVIDGTAGRFMALCEEFLDPAMYTRGRLVTVAGRVLGSRQEQIGELDYVYPVISCLEIHFWPQTPYDASRSYLPYPFHRPFHHDW